MGALRQLLSTLKGGRLVVALVILAGVLLLAARLAAAAYVEILWQQSTGYSAVFWRRMVWSWGTRITAGVLVVGFVYANLRLAAVSLGGIHIRRRFGNIEISEQLPTSYVSGAIFAAACLLGLWFGAAVPANLGVQIAAMMGADPWGIVEPILGRDVGFYVFELPVLASAVTFALDPGEPDRRHTVAWSSTPYAFYRLTFVFPEDASGAGGGPVGFEISPRYREP